MTTTTAKKTRKGFRVHCLKCGEENVSVTLHDLGEFHCDECEADFTADEVRARLAAWQKALAWIDAAPDYPEE